MPARLPLHSFRFPAFDEYNHMSDVSSPPSGVTIYHNPACSKSRETLALIRSAGIEPRVVEYLTDPPDRATLVRLVAAMDVPVRSLLRQDVEAYAQLHLDDASLGNDQLLDAMQAHPALINRPIVVTPLGTRLCRPSESVLELLPGSPRSTD